MSVKESGKLLLRMPDNDCRKFRRFTVSLTGRLIKIPDPNTPDNELMYHLNSGLDIDILDMSLSGLYCESQTQLMKGQQLWVILDLPNSTTALRAVVRRNTIRRENRTLFYGTGIQYIRSPLADSGITAVIDYLNGIVEKLK